MNRLWHWLVCFAALAASAAEAQEPPRYSRDIKPFFGRYCVECHNADKLKGGLNLETYEGLRDGDDNGAVVVPRKPDQSRLVLVVEGKTPPAMPPLKAKQPKRREKALLRAWVAAGATEDRADAAVPIPDIKPRVALLPPVKALAYRSDGRLLAAGSDREVILIDVTKAEPLGRLGGQFGAVTALSFSPDGKQLAVGSGAGGRAGELRIYEVGATGAVSDKPVRTLHGHRDVILNIAYSADGKRLATCSYDRLIKLWDAATGQELGTLRGHSDAVYAVAFSPDDERLASAAADRTVKVWDVASGGRLFTLSDATDWLYTLAWSPDGRRIAAAGVDKAIRVWEVSKSSGRLAESIFAHESPITRLIYSADGATLYSLAEDGTAKAWEASRLTERHVYPQQTDTVLSMALRPDGKQLTLGRYDGTVLLLDEATGKTEAQPIPPQPKPPHLTRLTPMAVRRGVPQRLLLEGDHLSTISRVVGGVPAASFRVIPHADRRDTRLEAEIVLSAKTQPGVIQVAFAGQAGETAKWPLIVDAFQSLPEVEPNDSPTTGQQVSVPATITGTLQRPGDVDWYRFNTAAGQQLGVQIITTPGDPSWEPVLSLTDAAAHLQVEKSGMTLAWTCATAGSYAVGVRDLQFRGSAKMHYRLHIGDLPIVTSVFPLGLQRGTTATVHLNGVNIGPDVDVKVTAPASAASGSRLPVWVETSQGKPLGDPTVVVGEFPEVVSRSAGSSLPVPGTANGCIDRPGKSDVWRFHAGKGQRLILEVNARLLGSPLDSEIELLDAHGQPVPRALLRCLAKIYTTFRDHDSRGAGIRLESWKEIGVDDYLYAGGELMRVLSLPRTPDDDCQFYQVDGQRLGFLDTTPTYHSLGTPLYKVAIEAPGSHFAPNGLPLIPIDYRNDDGGPGYDKDSRLIFDPPATGEYEVRIRDARAEGGVDYAYRLTVRPPRPAFRVRVNPTRIAIHRRGAGTANVAVERIDGFAGDVHVGLEGLPSGLFASPTTISGEDYTTSFAISAAADARLPAHTPPLMLIASATIDGKRAVERAALELAPLLPAGSLQVSTDRDAVEIHPGGQTAVTVHVKRLAGFKGRVPVDVRALPHGVRVLDIGLNGILITETQDSRTFAIAAEPWVRATSHPFVISARDETKGVDYAAPSVLLHVIPAARAK